MRTLESRPGGRLWLGLCAGLALLAACAPAHDWRELRAEGGPLQFMLPCRPSVLERPVQLAGQAVRLNLQACSAGGQTWAVASADLKDVTLVTPALQSLLATAQGNLAAAEGRALAWSAPGATPNPAARRVALQGRLPDGRAAMEQVAVFAYGTQVYQATVLGERLPEEAVDTFFGALRLVR